MLESKAYQTYYAFASREKAPKLKYIRKKADSDTSPKKKPVQATKAKQLKLATKRSKKDFHMSHTSGLGYGVDIQLKVPDEQQQKTSGTDEGTGTIPGVPDVPTYESESKKESWGDSEDEYDNDNDGDNDDDGDSDDHEDDKEEYDDEFYEEEESIDDEETMYDDEDNEVTKELYEDVNANLSGFEQVEEDAHLTITSVHDIQKADEPIQSSSVSSDFTSKLLNLENPSLADNEIASLMETSVCHATTIPKNTSGFTTTIPPLPPFFNPLQQEVTPTPTPITSVTTTSLLALPDFASVFKFNERVFNLEKDVSKIKQVNQYAQALSSIPVIVDHYMDNKLREAINKAILAHNLDCRQEAQDEKNAYIELVEMSMRALVKQHSTSLDSSSSSIRFCNSCDIEKCNRINRSCYLDKKNKSYDKADYKKKHYDALVESYNTDKDLFDSYEEPSHTVEDSGMQQDQEFVTGDNDEQPADKEVTKADWFKKPERPLTPDPDWSKR
ncbi:hypothetical protein Tco_1144795 [Tanacetum coccineum]